MSRVSTICGLLTVTVLTSSHFLPEDKTKNAIEDNPIKKAMCLILFFILRLFIYYIIENH
jgi:hypothetical protein